jgi:hypothetical protein
MIDSVPDSTKQSIYKDRNISFQTGLQLMARKLELHIVKFVEKDEVGQAGQENITTPDWQNIRKINEAWQITPVSDYIVPNENCRYVVVRQEVVEQHYIQDTRWPWRISRSSSFPGTVPSKLLIIQRIASVAQRDIANDKRERTARSASISRTSPSQVTSNRSMVDAGADLDTDISPLATAAQTGTTGLDGLSNAGLEKLLPARLR